MSNDDVYIVLDPNSRPLISSMHPWSPNRYLQRSIQQSNKGHNSVEDAIAALELAQLKVSKGPNFGAERSTDSIFDRLGR